jgi:hypothetical protein
MTRADLVEVLPVATTWRIDRGVRDYLLRALRKQPA